MMQSNKIKIVVTIGPATESEAMIDALMCEGVNAFRLNFSHGSHDEHLARILRIRKASKKHNRIVAIIQDLAGPEIRTTNFGDHEYVLSVGEQVVVTARNTPATQTCVPVNYQNLPADVVPGALILINDGRITLEIKSINGDDINTVVRVGGVVSEKRALNVRGATLSMPALTSRDKKDIAFGLAHGVDYIAFSFVRSDRDVRQLRALIKKTGGDTGIISKIETQAAVDTIDGIIDASDAIMVARGDLAPEIGVEKVPLVQKSIIRKCNETATPVITATQMLESMIKEPTPTRAEVSDIANAILDGTDAIMLSGETAKGGYPIEAVRVMTRVAQEIELSIDSVHYGCQATDEDVNAISYAVDHITNATGACAVVTLTYTGRTARIIATHRLMEPIIALCPDVRVAGKLAIVFGCVPHLVGRFKNLDAVIKKISPILKKIGIARAGDRVTVTAGVPIAKSTVRTNTVLTVAL